MANRITTREAAKMRRHVAKREGMSWFAMRLEQRFRRDQMALAGILGRIQDEYEKCVVEMERADGITSG